MFMKSKKVYPVGSQRLSFRGFTLIELLVAIAILGLLASIVFVHLKGAKASARDAERKGEVDSIRKALAFYYTEHNKYPESEEWISVEEDADFSQALSEWLPEMPEDPFYPNLKDGDENKPFSYQYSTGNTGGHGYRIHVEMEGEAYSSHEVSSVGGGGIVYGGGEWTCGDVISYAGQDYTTALIGTQCWLAENLNIATAQADKGDCSGYGSKYCHSDISSNCDTYGGLYQWTTMMCGEASSGSEPSGVQGICPTGWHIPSDDEWKTLEMNQGMSQATTDSIFWRGDDEGSKLAGNAALWTDGALDAHANFGTSGFTALPAGYRSTVGSYYHLGYYTNFWSSSTWVRSLSYGHTDVYRYAYDKLSGCSVRCIKD
ncbi:prepilin-type N-terminal cleavage/methylation domain-containing protein [Candidatus Parcubacteria bacterium]|nr:prepilin-type N-terminal cleavage/methylation domain-containing protein [Candidatus Parcubacteria bacterium]